MVRKSTSVVLHDFGASRLTRRTRFNRRGVGKDRFTIDIKAQPILHSFNDTALGALPAQAIRDELQQAIEQIRKPAKPSTVARRIRARASLQSAAPERSYVKQYSGGRTGLKLPGKTGYLYNDSRRLSEGLFVRQNVREQGFTVNYPANRLQEEKFIQELVRLVPELRNPGLLANSPEVNEAINKSIRQLIAKAENVNDLRRIQLRQARINALRATFGLVRSLASL